MKKLMILTLMMMSYAYSIAQTKNLQSKNFPISWQQVNQLNKKSTNTPSLQLDSVYLKGISINTNDTIIYARYLYEYNEMGKIGDLKMYYLYYEDEPLYAILNLRYSYTQEGQLESISKYIPYDENINTNWVIEEKQSFIYDDNNNILEIHNDYQEEFQNWINFTIQEFNYDENQHLINTTTYHKGAYKTEFTLSEKTDYTYYQDGKLEEQKDYYYDQENWKGTYGKQYNYNIENKISTQNILRYNEYTYDWALTNIYKYEYDQTGNTTNKLELSPTSENEIDTFRIINYEYNTEYSISNVAMPISLNDNVHQTSPEYFENIPMKENSKFKEDIWKQGALGEYFYSNFNATLSGIEINSKKKFSLYPNPTNQYISLNIKENTTRLKLEIYNLHGQKIKQYALTNTSKIDISDIKKGTYIIQIKSEHNNYKTQKLIIE